MVSIAGNRNGGSEQQEVTPRSEGEEWEAFHIQREGQ